ncbi:hypothetical protein [Aquibacillus rhizosphaerae]|uniref:Protein NO VEIN C-terminal domain-containing protein n=1 Tax=Aquibacillus rhizosphaerae TaxID=3051431 RepID=A0ABT7LAN8_9BACI|nr:hypothetical protein [Aquibacillus sp. LR5S19]MDL4842479.1 hypothetical protein [Aquibacillus sp. LR5S19]
MPKLNSKLLVSDPFLMNEDEVNIAVANHLQALGFENVSYLHGNATGIDVKGYKDTWKIYVESKGSHANKHNKDIVFDTNQIKTHTYMQVCKLMEYDSLNQRNTLLAMANPDIPRIRERVQKIIKSIDSMRFIRLWVQQNGSVKVDFCEELREDLEKIGLL